MVSLSRRLALVVLALAVSGTAHAQRGPLGSGPGGDHGPGPGGPGGPGREIAISPDGQTLIVHHTAATDTASATFKLSAVSTSGTVAWTWTAPAAIHDLAFLSGLVVVSTGGADPHDTSTTSTAAALVGLSLSSGAQAWSTAIDGSAHKLESTANGVELIVAKYTAPTGTATQGTVARTLELVNSAGAVVWTLALD